MGERYLGARQWAWAYDFYPAPFNYQIAQWAADGIHGIGVYAAIRFYAPGWSGYYVVKEESIHFAGNC